MPIYQTSKQLTKFGLVGISAVCVDLVFYYIFSSFLDLNISKALSFASGTFVTYNLNKYWTWRQNDRNTKRLLLFLVLYAVSMVINVGVNSIAFDYLPNSQIMIQSLSDSNKLSEIFAMKTNKFVAFFVATAVSSIFNFMGQKFWVFKENSDTDQDENHS